MVLLNVMLQREQCELIVEQLKRHAIPQRLATDHTRTGKSDEIEADDLDWAMGELANHLLMPIEVLHIRLIKFVYEAWTVLCFSR